MAAEFLAVIILYKESEKGNIMSEKYSRRESQVEEPKRKAKNNKGLIIFAGIVVAAILIGLIVNALAPKKVVGFKEGPFSSGTQNVAEIHIKGEITEKGDTYNQEWLTGQINNAKFDKDNQGILLILDTPGGTVYESDETYNKLVEYKKETDRPVYAYMTHMAASGGYYIAAAADKIYSNRNGMTGSIGVIAGANIDATGLMDKIGLKMDYIHSGANKLMGSPIKPMTEEQIGIMQTISDEYYNQFVSIVAEGRKMEEGKVRELADGRIYTAAQAEKNGLIDGVGEYEANKQRMIEAEGLGKEVEFEKKEYTQPANIFKDMIGVDSKILSNIFGKGEVSATMETLNDLKVSEPMYLYQP